MAKQPKEPDVSGEPGDPPPQPENFEQRVKLLELDERRADRALKRHEIELTQGRGLRFTTGQATVAAAALALVSAIVGGLIQGWATADVETRKSSAQVAIEQMKVEGELKLEQQKQEATERLERAKFETTLILKATEAAKREDQIKNLKFFLDAGFISDVEGKIAKIDEKAYPSLPTPTTPLTTADIVLKVRDSVGRLEAKVAHPGGDIRLSQTFFLISKDGYALTVALGLPEEGTVFEAKVTTRAGSRERELKVVGIERSRNLALIRFTSPADPYSPIPISADPLSIAEDVSIVGYTDSFGFSMNNGNIVARTEEGEVIVNMFFTPGHAGSPVLDSDGNVAAVLVEMNDGGSGVAVPIALATGLLNTAMVQ